MERHNIAPGFVEDALESVRVRGIDVAPLMAQIGLSERVTEPVTNVEYGRLWWLIAETINDEFFGLAARPMRPGSFNLLCHAVLHAGTLERALRRALQFLNVVLDDPQGELRIRDGMAHVVLTSEAGLCLSGLLADPDGSGLLADRTAYSPADAGLCLPCACPSSGLS